jgi:plastocyanin
MRRTLAALLLLAALSGPLLAQPAFAQDNANPQVSIIEPDAQPPQAWTYDPNILTVPVGTTVTWTNIGAAPHTVTSDDGASFDSGNMDPQVAFSFTAASPGTFTYHCNYHPWMTGEIDVSS